MVMNRLYLIGDLSLSLMECAVGIISPHAACIMRIKSLIRRDTSEMMFHIHFVAVNKPFHAHVLERLCIS